MSREKKSFHVVFILLSYPNLNPIWRGRLKWRENVIVEEEVEESYTQINELKEPVCIQPTKIFKGVHLWFIEGRYRPVQEKKIAGNQHFTFPK